MNIFTLTMFAGIGGGLLLAPRANQQRRKFFCIYMSILIVLIAVLRGNYTSDMERYAVNFARVAGESWEKVFQEKYHIGLYIFIKLLSYISSNTQFFYGVLGLIFAVAIGMLIYQYSYDPMLSYVILIPMGYLGFTFTGIAQGLSLSLIIFGYMFLEQKKYIPFAVSILLAGICHTSAFIAILLFVFNKVKINKLLLLVMAVAYGIIYIFKYEIGALLIAMASYGDYKVEISEGGIAELCIYLSIIVAAIIVFRKELMEDNSIKFCFLTCVMGALLFTFVPVLTEFFRVAMYFNIFIVVLIPAVVYKSGKGALVKLFVYFFLFLEYFGFTYGSSGMDLYTFFWK